MNLKENRTWIFVGLVLLLPIIAFYCMNFVSDRIGTLPYYGANSQLADGSIEYHEVPAFEFLNQDSILVGTEDVRDKIKIVNFFFTACPTICPEMSRNLQKIHELIYQDDGVVIMSHTVNPERDGPARLKRYGEKYGVKSDQWQFLTGGKADIYAMARNGYYVSASEGDGGQFDFIHSENLVLVDRENKIRGYYAGTESSDIQQLIKDLTKLKKEYL